MSNTFQMFWVVWNPSKETPTITHETFSEALTEAQRISEREIGPNEIYVLQAVSRCVKEIRTELITSSATQHA